MGQLQVDLDMALRQRDRALVHDGPRPGPRDDLAVTLAVAHLVGDLPRALDPHTRGDLTMLAAPELRDLLAQTCVELARAGDDGRAEREPRRCGKDEDGRDGQETGDGH